MSEMHDERVFQYVIDAKDRIVSANDDWFAFARENGAAHLDAETVRGRSLWDFLAGIETRELYKVLLRNVRERKPTITVPYRCDSPDMRRKMELIVSKRAGGGVEFNSRILQQEKRDPIQLLASHADRTDELIVMCSWCKKIRNLAGAWVEVEDAVNELCLFESAKLPRISHGMCDPCMTAFTVFRM
jgi:hypothetical protein